MNKKIFIIILFAVMMFGLGVRAATAGLVTLPNAEDLPSALSMWMPLIFKNNPVVDAITSSALYVFPSTATTNGNAGGRDGLGQICRDEDINSHVCTINEIENAFATTGVVFKNPFVESWVDGPRGLGTYLRTNDTGSDWSSGCDTWTNEGSGYGGTIDSSANILSSNECSIAIPVSCCKRTP